MSTSGTLLDTVPDTALTAAMLTAALQLLLLTIVKLSPALPAELCSSPCRSPGCCREDPAARPHPDAALATVAATVPQLLLSSDT